ncbi:hypothetical protein H8356DRAFT_81730 [Neocallimastix lanati (nom. inval.)]|jgi:hypothetical protein|nr:hypothetical protein H8356DRAFT_81730 [Neocallimastix sp. JGI-2020a]
MNDMKYIKYLTINLLSMKNLHLITHTTHCIYIYDIYMHINKYIFFLIDKHKLYRERKIHTNTYTHIYIYEWKYKKYIDMFNLYIYIYIFILL